MYYDGPISDDDDLYKRLVDKINANKKALADEKGEVFVPETIKEIRSRIVSTEGEDAWHRLVSEDIMEWLAERRKEG